MQTANAQISLRIRAVWSGLRCPQTESLGIKDCFSGGQYPDETDDVNPHILRMLKKNFFARRGQSITV